MERKPSAASIDPPDSWESEDFEERLKNLSIRQVKPIERTPSPSLDSNPYQNGQNMEPNQALVEIPGVDPFLIEALQNPKDRITILRMEQDVERFIRSPNMTVFEFPRMASSYHRMIAHKVAQHYLLQTRSGDYVEGEGGRIIAEKPDFAIKWPSVKLADIPGLSAEPSSIEKGKFKIKLRSREVPAGSGQLSGPGAHHLSSSRTVEERKEEYERARARIFSSESLKAMDEGARVVTVVPEAERTIVKSESLVVERKSAALAIVQSAEAMELESLRNLGGKDGRRVAIIRDVEKEKKDPDFNRSYNRFPGRPDPNYGPNPRPLYGYQMPYPPVMAYNTEFPALGPNSMAGGHLRMPPGMYCDPGAMSMPGWQPGMPVRYPPPPGGMWRGGVAPMFYPGYAPQGNPGGLFPAPHPPPPAIFSTNGNSGGIGGNDYPGKDPNSTHLEPTQQQGNRRV